LFLAKEKIKRMMVPLIFIFLIFLAVIVMFIAIFQLILSFHPDILRFLF
jgi:hypothetical protein